MEEQVLGEVGGDSANGDGERDPVEVTGPSGVGRSRREYATDSLHVRLLRYGDHYEWNKVVTCIHNVFSQQRYLEHYGEVTIRNLASNVCTCKITFVKVPAPPQSRSLRSVPINRRWLPSNAVSILELGLEQERGAGLGAGPNWERDSPLRGPVARRHLLRHAADSQVRLEAQ